MGDDMRYYCSKCKKYWTTREDRYTIVDPVRDCPECLAKEGYRWITPASATKVRI